MPGQRRMCRIIRFKVWETAMIFTARIQIELDEDAMDKMRGFGVKDIAIIHRICDEIQRREDSILTELGQLEFTDCEIKE